MESRLRREWERIGEGQTWRAAWHRTWAGWQPIDMVPYELALATLLVGTIPVLLLFEGFGNPIRDIGALGLAVLATALGLVWLLWDPPWMRAVNVPLGSREAQFAIDHPLVFALSSSLLWPSFGVGIAVVGWRAWMDAGQPLRPVVAAVVSIGLAGVWMYGAVIRRYQIGGSVRWIICNFGAVLSAGMLLAVLGTGASQAFGAALAVPFMLSFPVLAWVRWWRLRHDRVAVDAELARMAEVTGQDWRPYAVPQPQPQPPEGYVSYHWPPDSMRHRTPRPSTSATDQPPDGAEQRTAQ
jgi:hypothetical protein